ncbi:hypothetical protein HY485_04740 [Candidatus Woesearchaeota archaeon]|nr:hypothetical protein [Candidatus Woesearchaeota archaeon]
MWNPFRQFFATKETASATEQKKERLRTQALRQLNSLRKQKDPKKLVVQLHLLLRDFFKQYFNLRYAFTNEELADELSRRKIDRYLKRKTAKILERVTEARYNVEHTREELKALIEDTKQVVSLL